MGSERFPVLRSLDDFRRLRAERDDIDGLGALVEWAQLRSSDPPGARVYELGVYLELLRFTEETVADAVRDENAYAACADDRYLDAAKWAVLKTRCGFTDESAASFFQAKKEHHIIHGLNNFQLSWQVLHAPARLSRRWNPPYAPLGELSTGLVQLCEESRDTYALLTTLNIAKTDRADIAVFPMDGWTLSRCVQLQYERALKGIGARRAQRD